MHVETIIVAILTSTALSAFVNNIFLVRSERRKANDGVQEGVRLLLYDRIKYLAKRHIAAGQISAEDLEDIMHMWQCYHGPLGGNGYLDNLMAAVNRLPITSK